MNKIAVCLMVVGMLVSGGIAARADSDEKGPVASARTITVPNVCGKTLSEAIAALTAAGLNRETQQSDRDGERRIVVRQDPAAGAKVARGTIIKIYGQLAAPIDDNKGRVSLPRK